MITKTTYIISNIVNSFVKPNKYFPAMKNINPRMNAPIKALIGLFEMPTISRVNSKSLFIMKMPTSAILFIRNVKESIIIEKRFDIFKYYVKLQ